MYCLYYPANDSQHNSTENYYIQWCIALTLCIQKSLSHDNPKKAFMHILTFLTLVYPQSG